MKRKWIPDGDGHYSSDGKIGWRRLELDDAAIMLQEFMPQRRPEVQLGPEADIEQGYSNPLHSDTGRLLDPVDPVVSFY